jgi:hypothetical protein
MYVQQRRANYIYAHEGPPVGVILCVMKKWHARLGGKKENNVHFYVRLRNRSNHQTLKG